MSTTDLVKKARLTTSTSKKAKTQKSYQLRLTITPQIQADLEQARQQYPYLNDLEIIKIWLGYGRSIIFKPDPTGSKSAKKHTKDEITASLDLPEPTDEEMMKHASHIFQLGENWDEEEDNIDYSKARPVNWSNFSF